MKKLYFLLLVFSFFSTVNAQIVNIPDANFKARLLASNSNISIAENLLGVNFKIDANNDGQIQVSEALNVGSLKLNYCCFEPISNLLGIQSFVNLKNLDCSNNNLTSLNISSLLNLGSLYCENNSLSSLDVSLLVKLVSLDCSGNLLTSLDFSSLVKLAFLNCSNNQLSSLNVSSLINLTHLDSSNNQLSTLNVSSLVNLTGLFCSNNKLSSLNVSSLLNLTDLYCENNSLSSLDVSLLVKLYALNCSKNQLASLNVSSLVNLASLDCSTNQLTSLNVSKLLKLYYLNCSDNKIVGLDIGNLTSISRLECNNNLLTKLNVSGLKNLQKISFKNNIIDAINLDGLKNVLFFDCSNNKLTSLDFSGIEYSVNFNLERPDPEPGYSINPNYILSNNELTYINLKNSNFFNVEFKNNFNLEYICVNDDKIQKIQNYIAQYGYTNCNVNTYCSFVPGGINYVFQGNLKLDNNKNGCDVNDIVLPNLKYNITNSTITGSLISDTSGNYSIPVQAGTHTITPVLENPTYFTVSPTTVNVTFPTQTSPFTQNFCIAPNGVRPDLEVTLLPLQPARPGFDAKYKLVYKNKGNTTQSGAVNLTFNDAVLDLVVSNPMASSQTTNTLSWNFTALQPFETREITFTMNVNSPMETPAVNNGDILAYTSTITSSTTDETPTDNTFTFNQTVVGSYDPNDKTCLEGNVISPNLIGQYVHYTIRFENTGTFAAENVVVKDMIDLAKFDISTLVPTSASHLYTTRISDGNKVEFIFENINLPFDDANNDGYIAFKIKTKPTLVVNDSFSNEASIYFDYNFPIVTEKATSTFKTLGTQDYDFDQYFTVYPNPVNDILNISTKEAINTQSMEVYNTLGQLVLVVTNAEKTSNIDVSSLSAGNYFLQIKTDKGSSSSQFVKE